jgi:hypothetical protein
MLNLEAWAKTASLRSTEAGRERILNDEFAQTSEQALHMIYTIDEVKHEIETAGTQPYAYRRAGPENHCRSRERPILPGSAPYRFHC